MPTPRKTTPRRTTAKPKAYKAPSKGKGGGIDLPKFAGEVASNVGKALDSALPSRRASSTVSRAMRNPSVRGGNSLGQKGFTIPGVKITR